MSMIIFTKGSVIITSFYLCIWNNKKHYRIWLHFQISIDRNNFRLHWWQISFFRQSQPHAVQKDIAKAKLLVITKTNLIINYRENK